MVQYRIARPSDAAKVVSVHFTSARAINHSCYPAELLEAWSTVPSDSRVSWLASVVGSASTIAYVAESETDEIVGFCMVLTDARQLKSLYVAGSSVREQ